MSSLIREQDPLKQGLKLKEADRTQDFDIIREQDPLKQGLKPQRNPGHRRLAQKFVSKIH